MKNICNCGHHVVIPFIMVVFGVTFLMGFYEAISWDMVNFIWPILVIIAGVTKIIEKRDLCKCCDGRDCNCTC